MSAQVTLGLQCSVLLGSFSSIYVRLGQVKSGYVSICQVYSGKVSLFEGNSV
jgi:hypothetical protein